MNDLKAADQQKADAFLEDFVRELGGACGSDIDFILLFGSAARGEFILGKSDVDLVISVKSNKAVRVVEQFAEPLFWRLDEKHGMMFKRVVSTGKSGSLLEDAIKKLEKQARLYKPFEVFGPDDIDWRAGRVKRLDLLPGAALVASQLTLFYKMKHEGKILFGRDIRPEIEPRFSLWEKLKAIWVPQSIAFASIILALPLPQKAVAYAVKALFYEVDSVNLFQKNMVPLGQEKRIQEALFDAPHGICRSDPGHPPPDVPGHGHTPGAGTADELPRRRDLPPPCPWPGRDTSIHLHQPGIREKTLSTVFHEICHAGGGRHMGCLAAHGISSLFLSELLM
ncbi:MAG: nucleotidyltransferase domain-containing protein [Methanothrix sp.]|nr:nucleotidyltransferase domain-containing protein [Methanothrix sp.]